MGLRPRWYPLAVLVGLAIAACGTAPAPRSQAAVPASTVSDAPTATPAPTPVPTPVPWRSSTTDDGLVSFQYPAEWSAQNCSSPPFLTGNGAPTQAASFLFVPDGAGKVQPCDYSQAGLVTDPTNAAPPWIAVSELIQPADTNLWDTCGEALVAQTDVLAADGTAGTKYSYEASSGPTCGLPVVQSPYPYSGPPLGLLVVYRFPLHGSQHFAYCVVQDRETPSSPDERQNVEQLVEQALRIG